MTARAVTTMTALAQQRYGSPDVLSLVELPRPVPGAGAVLVRVHAASVNARDWHIMRGEPRIARLIDRGIFGRTGPRQPVRGTDFAGTVLAVGAGVTRWRPGDAVYGEAEAAFAEYLVAAEDVVAAIPAGTSFEQAAALPLAANTALTCLRAGAPRPGQRVLINGASGGVGTFVVQLARSLGLHVTAVCSERNTDLVRSLGADVVVDYRREDFARLGTRYHLILDLVGNRSLTALRRTLEPGGTLVLSGGGVSGQGRFLGPIRLLVRGLLVSRLTRLKVALPRAKPSGQLLEELAEYLSAGTLTPVIDRVFPLAGAADAIGYLETEHARAKVVISLQPAGPKVPNGGTSDTERPAPP